MYSLSKSILALGLLSLAADVATAAPSVVTPRADGSSTTTTPWGATCTDLTLAVSVAQSTPGNFSLDAYDYKILSAIANRQTLASNTYNISTRICTPSANSTRAETIDSVQLLVHGATFSKIMWDLPYQPENYSWTKKMNEAGYPTIAIDLVGAGNSSKPHPVLEAQTGTYVEAVHQIILLLRSGSLHPDLTNRKLTFVGFSIGSIVANSLAERYPTDIDTLVLLGITWDLTWIYPAFLGGLQTSASTIDPVNWGHLDPFYQTQPTLATREMSCFFGAYDKGALDADFKYRDFDSLGAALSFTYHLVGAPVFSGPVFLGIGENDMTFCGEKCGSQPYAVYDKFPSASEHEVKVYPETGHMVLFHYSGMQMMNDILGFLEGK